MQLNNERLPPQSVLSHVPNPSRGQSATDENETCMYEVAAAKLNVAALC